MSGHTVVTGPMVNIAEGRFTDGKPNLRRYHQAKWDEPVIFELSQPGERAILVPELEPAVEACRAKALASLPKGMRRTKAPALPELSQNRVLRHYLRLSQENLGADFNVDIGQGTCTMKYNPKINEQLARSPRMADLHPLQPDASVQGILEVVHVVENVMKELSGMDAVSLQPRSGSQAIYANLAMIRAYHEHKGQGATRDEAITTIFSHPSDAACAKVLGYKVITLHSDPVTGLPTLESLKAALSNRTAALVITNPEDTGIFNSAIQAFTAAAHAAGALCCYDQANANGLMGITRAREAGFDLCHFNLHKTFATPHGCGGPGSGACCVTRELEPFLPSPRVVKEGDRFALKDGGPLSVGPIASFQGNCGVILRAYAWIMSLGAQGLREASAVAVLNNNYTMSQLLKIKGLTAPYAKGHRRIEQVRYSWEKLTQETGVKSEEIGLRAADLAVHYWTSHHPWIVPEPATVEPTESYSKADLDEFVQVMAHIAHEARTTPEVVKTAPHNCPSRRADPGPLDDPARWAMTWRAYQRKLKEHK